MVDKYFFYLFYSTYNKADAFVVLASEFETQLRNWGLKQPIYLETTLVDDELLGQFNLTMRYDRIESHRGIRLLFLAGVEKKKGICEAIEATRKLSVKYPDLHLLVAGDGSFMDGARNLADTLGIKNNVSFLGYLRGEEKHKVLLGSHIYVLPTFHGEGMPNSVLEAMAFGLPVVTRPVGGLKDFFVNGEHGFITDSTDPSIIASLIEKIIVDKVLWKKISSRSYEYAREIFLASKVARRLENIYRKTLNND